MEPNLADVEVLRRNLEDKVTKLRQSLQTWRTWEAEYEGLKEELQAVEGEPSSDDLVWTTGRLRLQLRLRLVQLSLARDFGGSLIDEKGKLLLTPVPEMNLKYSRNAGPSVRFCERASYYRSNRWCPVSAG